MEEHRGEDKMEDHRGREEEDKSATHSAPRRLTSLSWVRPSNLPAGEQLVVVIERGGGPIGFKIAGGSDSRRKQGFVYVAEGSVSKTREGLIKEGDIILQARGWEGRFGLPLLPYCL